MSPKLRNGLRLIFFLGLGVFFIWIFLRNLSPEQRHEILRSMGEANYFWIILAIPLGVLAHHLRAVRWRMLIRPLGYEPRLSNMFFAVFIGYFANLAIPRLGEISRCSVLTRYEKVPFQKSFGTVITERALDMVVFVLLFFLNLALQYKHLAGYIDEKIYKPVEQKLNLSMDLSGSLSLLVLVLAALALLLFVLLRKKILKTKLYTKMRELVSGFVEGLKSLLKVEKPWLFVVYSLAIWLLYLIMAYIVFFSMPESSRLGISAGLAVLVFGTIGIMLVQGGIGIYPAIVAETLVLYGVPSIKGYALGWLIWSSQTITIVLVGILSLILLPILNKSHAHDNRNHPPQNI